MIGGQRASRLSRSPPSQQPIDEAADEAGRGEDRHVLAGGNRRERIGPRRGEHGNRGHRSAAGKHVIHPRSNAPSATIAAMAAGKTVSAGVTVPTNSTMPNHLAPMAGTGSFGAAARSSSPTQIAPSANSTKSATATAKTNTVAAHRTRKMVRTIMPGLVRQGLALSRRAL